MKLTETTTETEYPLIEWFLRGWIYAVPNCANRTYTFVSEYENEELN